MNLTQGTSREQIDPADVAALRAHGVLINDARRERPRYFDGRFLAARDLIREQQYFLTREADLGRAAGSGVAAGLFVREGAEPQTLEVQAGHGSTQSGELVLLPRPVKVRLANIPMAEQLSARFGLSRQPAPPMRSRTGLFVLALRPVEFTANPIGAYPTSITGQRSVEDGDIIEGTAIVLVPWNDDGATDALQARRGRAARAIFTQGVERGVSANVLPLAMLALQNNTLVWIDEAMVRRELGADRGDIPGLGFAPRALRLAHLMQYQEHLQDVAARSNGGSFPASTYFPALPSAGPLPAGVINVADFTQNFFPAEIDVDFSIVPEDELPALVDEALALQAIDLSAPVESLDSTAVMILAPVPRHEWRAVVTRLSTVTTRLIKPAAPNLLAQRKPFEVLQQLRVPRPAQGALDPSNASDAEWQRLARLPSLWFVRRRHLAYRDDYTGVWQQVTGIDERATPSAPEGDGAPADEPESLEVSEVEHQPNPGPRRVPGGVLLQRLECVGLDLAGNAHSRMLLADALANAVVVRVDEHRFLEVRVVASRERTGAVGVFDGERPGVQSMDLRQELGEPRIAVGCFDIDDRIQAGIRKRQILGIPLDEYIECNIVLVYLKNRQLPKAVMTFVDFMKQASENGKS